MGIKKFDDEGRLITLEYKGFFLVNVYVPSLNPHSNPERPDYRIEWDKALKKYISKLQKPVIMCGDFNVAHAFIDSYPENEKNEPDQPFFRSEVREGFDQLLSIGLVDVFRALYPNKEGAYTWWGPKNRNRAENRGSRLDYFLISGELLSCVQSVKFHIDTIASDHCPISMIISLAAPKENLDDEDLAVLWRTIDWPKMEDALRDMQRKLALAAFERRWKNVTELQRKITSSWAAKVLAVRTVVNTNSEVGVDGVRWKTDMDKARAARSLTAKGYRPLPYRNTEIEDNGKKRIIHVPSYRDKAMIILYAYALDPVAESMADRKSFSARKGRSTYDAHSYLVRDLSGSDAPQWAVVIDVKAYYSNVIHDWLLSHIPMDKVMLSKFLKAGVVIKGELFPTNQGISLDISLSPILGNMMLDGLQSYIYDHLYPDGGVDYLDGNLLRFADDMIITARSKTRAATIMQAVIEFLAERGLRVNSEKTFIVNLNRGFNFLSRHYQRKKGVLFVTPSEGSIKKIERELTNFILNYNGPLRVLIEKINHKLTGWASYHSVEDAYMEFRHIDAVVEGLLVRKMCDKYPRWHRETVLNKFWIHDAGDHIFALPDNRSIHIIQLAQTPIVQYKPCRLKFNPYLDDDYESYLRHRRAVQKASGKYRAVWNRQNGRCAYCGKPMLPDQEVKVIEHHIGEGHSARNLLYIHRKCAYDIFDDADESTGELLDLFSLLDDIMDDTPSIESPYLELTEFFKKCNKTPVSLTFSEIENILADALDWEAYFYKAFWYNDTPGYTSKMWHDEGFPFHFFLPSTPDYCIAESWLSQGYRIKALHLERQRVVFRRAVDYQSALMIPKALMQKKLPDKAVHECKRFFAYLIKKYGL